MKRVSSVFLFITFCFLIFSTFVCGDSTPKDSELAAVTRNIADKFANELKSELLAALEDSAGTIGAIRICAERAPEISAQYSSIPGLTVKRTSKRYRNPDNAPDEYEMKTLEMFESRPAFGSKDHFEWKIKDGAKTFRYVRAIKTSSTCLKCHGDPQKIDPEVLAAINEKYENDQATGFGLGDLRGILTVSLKWPEGRAVYDSISAEL